MNGRKGTIYVRELEVGSVTSWTYSYLDRAKMNGWIQAHVESDPFTQQTLLLNSAREVDLLLEDRDGYVHQGKFYVKRMSVSGRNKIYGSLSAKGTLVESTQ